MSPVHDYVIDNSTGANVRSDINSVLQAILSNNSNSSAPSTTAAYMLWVDTTANIVKIRNSSDNAWINLFTTAGGIDVDAASNFNEDVTFTGASYNVVWDKSDNALEFADNAKAIFGTGSDFQIYHDGTNSRLKNTGGQLQLESNGSIVLGKTDLSESYLKAHPDGAVQLYYDNTKRFETTSDGVQIYGLDNGESGARGDFKFKQVDGTSKIMFDASTAQFEFLDNSKATFGSGDDLRIYHDGSNSYIGNATGDIIIENSGGNTSNQLRFRAKTGEESIVAHGNGAVVLYYDNSKKLETTSSGVTVTGTVTETSDIALKSNIQPLTNTLEKIQQITGYKYNLINSISPSMGVIAQDVEKVFPELVHGSQGKKTLQYSGLIGVLVEAVKDLSAKVAALETA